MPPLAFDAEGAAANALRDCNSTRCIVRTQRCWIQSLRLLDVSSASVWERCDPGRPPTDEVDAGETLCSLALRVEPEAAKLSARRCADIDERVHFGNDRSV